MSFKISTVCFRFVITQKYCSRKTKHFGKVYFHHEMFGFTCFWLNLGIGICNVVKIITKYFVNMSFHETPLLFMTLIILWKVKIHIEVVMRDKWCVMFQTWFPNFFFKVKLKGRTKIPHLGCFNWPRWLSYLHYILQTL